MKSLNMASSNGAVGHSPSSGSLSSNITNGQPASDFEVISQPPSSSSLQNGHAVDLGNVSPLIAASVTSTLPSLTDITLNQAVQRIQELSNENQELRDFLRSNSEVMKKQFHTLMEYKEKVRNANAYHREKFQQTKILVLSLRDEKTKLQEECDGLRSKLSDIERSNNALSQHRRIGDSVVNGLQKEVDSLQQKLAFETAEKADMIVVSKDDVPANDETAKLIENIEFLNKENKAIREENSNWMKDVCQLKYTADQILADLESTQTLKSDRDHECKQLGQENTRLSAEIQHTLKEVCELRAKNNSLVKHLKELQRQLGSQSDGSFVKVGSLRVSPLQSMASDISAQNQLQHTSASQTTESLLASKVEEGEEECKSLTLNSNALADMLSQIQAERDMVAQLRGALAEKDNEIQRLEKELCSKEEVLLSKTTRIESSAEEVTAEQAKVISDIQATTDKLCAEGARQTNSNEDIMKSQVLTLIHDLHESQTKLKAATDALDSKNKRVLDLEAQNSALSTQLERQRKQDDSFIDSMRLNLSNLEQALAAERVEHQNTRKQLAELRGSFNSLVQDYRDLLDTFDNYRLEKESESTRLHTDVKQAEEIGKLMAQLIGAEEAIAYRDSQIRELKMELEKIPVLKAQADVYKSDFDAERKAREKQHEEKEVILQDMNNLQTRNQQLLDELESLSHNQIVQMQLKHAPGTLWNRSEPKHSYTMVPPPSANQRSTPQSRYPYPGPQEGEQGAGAMQYPHDDVFDYTQMDEICGGHHCPKCGVQCPDIDSLQLHVIECLDNDTTTKDTFRM
ncbi:optineurin-like [Liolophura sinensis]|uniref:optineurin-like n=1 Tax=Liolophura sinensis TaxID=3198878 RepID=UPI003159688A